MARWTETEVERWYALTGYADALRNLLSGGQDDFRKEEVAAIIRRMGRIIETDPALS